MRKLDKLIEWLFYLFLFLLPWQTRLIIKDGILNGGYWEWGTISFFAIDLVFIMISLFFCCRVIFTDQTENGRLPKKMMFFVLLFLTFSFVSIFWAENRVISFYHWLRLLEGVFLFIFIQKINFSIVRAGWSLVLAGLVQISLALVQFINQNVFSSKWLGIAAQNVFQVGVSVVETAEGRILRLYGSFSHPNIFAGYLVFLIFVLFVLYFSSKNFWQKNLILFISSLATMTLYFTFSRAAWISLLINLILLVIFIFKKAAKNFRTPFFEFFGLVLIIFVMFSVLTARDFLVRIEARGRLENISVKERMLNFDRGQEIVKKNFLLGVGLGNYSWELFKKYPNLTSWDYQPIANIYLLILAELGLVGLLLFLSMVLFVFLRLGFNVHTPILASLLFVGLFDHWLFSLSFGILLFYLALGLLWKRYQPHEVTGEENIF